MQCKEICKKIWYFLWESDSIWSWFANIILAFVLIKFIVYPGLGLLLATGYPVVAVVSGSMEHDGAFQDWWKSSASCNSQSCAQEQWYAAHGITQEQFFSYSFKNGFNKGDIMVLKGVKPKNIKTGDVLVFMSSEKADPIIHRVIAIQGDEATGYVFQTKGDHNADSGSIDTDIQEQEILGKAVFRIPFLGWVKILAITALNGFLELVR